MIIQVTQEHINKASTTGSFCAICHALVDAFPEWEGKNFDMRSLPLKAKRFRRQMLEGKPVKPFSFKYSEDLLECVD